MRFVVRAQVIVTKLGKLEKGASSSWLPRPNRTLRILDGDWPEDAFLTTQALTDGSDLHYDGLTKYNHFPVNFENPGSSNTNPKRIAYGREQAP